MAERQAKFLHNVERELMTKLYVAWQNAGITNKKFGLAQENGEIASEEVKAKKVGVYEVLPEEAAPQGQEPA